MDSFQQDISRKRYIEQHLITGLIGKPLYYYESISSTMDVGRELIRKGVPEGTVVVTSEQKAGRGRLNRTWVSPPGVVAMSVILRPALSIVPQLIMIASLAVAGAIREHFQLDAMIKWPNDVLINGKKVCGILIENEVMGNTVNSSNVGIGINVDFDPSKYPDIMQAATSLSHECGHSLNKDDVICAVLKKFDGLYLRVKAGNSVYEDWRDAMDVVGRLIRVKAGESVIEGMVEAVTYGGNLVVRRSDGRYCEVVVGDVTVIKS
ncbi:MAG TPA: biotin--[acetyl-CoA-carboxylase] ligase [Dehalococcoidia bacterium]|nr:biotin--[acetyl-CoA-carboxylase] ligase [Dehalococcoidia bacterium]